MTNVYITVDTENSMGGAWADTSLRPVPSDRHIFCNIGGESHGIGWMCRELNARRLRATFFSEVFGSLVFGEDDTRRWVGFLLEQGQDVQLHTHLNFYYYPRWSGDLAEVAKLTDDLAALAPPLRGEVLGQAMELFHRAAGFYPVAFRAGSWRCNRGLMKDLGAKGIVLDASFNRSLQGRGSFDGEDLQVNALQKIEGVWELPITVAHQSLPDPVVADGLRALDPISMSCWEMKKVLDDAAAAGSPHVSAVFHSFHGVKTKDQQYRELRPDRIVKGRFEFLLDYLAANRDKFRVATVGSLAEELRDGGMGVARASVAELGFVRPLARKVVQVVNRII